MRPILCLLLLALALPVQAGEYSNLAVGILAVSRPAPPKPSPPGCDCGICDCAKCNCGKVSALDRRLTDLESAVIENQKEVVDALKQLKTSLEATPTLPADAKPTPLPALGKALQALNLKPTDTLVDFGAGHDSRVLINAAQLYGVKNCVGVEIDSATAESARRYVEKAGLADSIKIVEGDAAKVDTKANVGFAYLFTDTLSTLVPQIKKLDRFVSYMHPVPGLSMTHLGDGIYLYERQAAMQLVQPTVAYWNGRAYSRANPGCNCAMCQSIRAQLAPHYVSETATTSAPAGHWEYRKSCNGRTCSVSKVWVQD